MDRQQTVVWLLLLLLFAGVSAWLQFGLLGKSTRAHSSITTVAEVIPHNGYDYAIENFTSTGMDRLGKKYHMTADRLVHKYGEEQALLTRPHIIQYDLSGAPRHIYADSGRFNQDDSQVLLSGNVKVVDNHSGAAVVTTQTMQIHLKGERGD